MLQNHLEIDFGLIQSCMYGEMIKIKLPIDFMFDLVKVYNSNIGENSCDMIIVIQS